MARLIVFLIVTAGLAFATSWLADRPGEVGINWLGYHADTSVVVLMGAVAALFRIPARRKETGAGRFETGQQVRARNINPVTHTRLPRYARGKFGTIERDHGVFAFADTSAWVRFKVMRHFANR